MSGVNPCGGPADRLSAGARRAVIAFLLALPLAAGQPAADTTGEVLLGRTHPSAILAVSPEWQRRYDEYQPETHDLEGIRHAPEGSLVMVYFGSWCGDSRLGVPHFLKILDEAQAPHLKARYVAVDRTKKEPAQQLDGVGLELVPTFVLRIRGREIGRIVETPATTLEHDLALLFRKAAANPAP